MSATLPGTADLPRACARHPGRAPVALCRTCLTPSCGECVTKIDGINLCAEHLPAKRETPARVPLRRNAGRALFSLGAYSLVSIAAAAIGIAMPFFALEMRLQANRDRLVEVGLKLSAYQNDIGAYPSRERGLTALLVSGGEDGWSGPYTTTRASGGRPPLDPAHEGQVIDFFGRPILYYASDREDGEELPDRIYLASAGANGTWDTPGIERGSPPREPEGDDAIEWVVW